MRVIFRADFQGPKGELNPLNLNMGEERMPIEIFRKGNNWRARWSNGNVLKLPGEATHGSMKDAVEACFETRMTPWTMHRSEDGILLDPDYFEEDPKGNFTQKEVTHVGATGPYVKSAQGANYFTTACGETVHVRFIRSTRGPNPPLCKICKVEWSKTPPEKRLA